MHKSIHSRFSTSNYAYTFTTHVLFILVFPAIVIDLPKADPNDVELIVVMGSDGSISDESDRGNRWIFPAFFAPLKSPSKKID